MLDPHQAKIYTAILLACVIVGIIILYFIISLIKHQRKNLELYTLKIQAEVTTAENERTRIACDLHDEIGPLLSAVKFKISSLDTLAATDVEMVDEANMHIDTIIHRMREISNDLMPNTLLRKGVIYAMEEFISSIRNMNGLRINFTHSQMPDLPKEKAINLYRVLQEIIQNTNKHAKATRLDISLGVDKNILIMLSEDNGIGFDANLASKQNTGLGLRNIVSRTDIMQGDLYVESKIGKGTKYIIEIPL